MQVREKVGLFDWDEPKKEPVPKALLKRRVWERDKGICQVCFKPADIFNWELGHRKARSRGGKLTFENTMVVHPFCNRSQNTASQRRVHRIVGIETEEDKAKAMLKEVPLVKLKYIAKKHDVVLHSKTIDDGWESRSLAPTRRQYVNAIAKAVGRRTITNDLNSYTPPVVKKRRKKKDTWPW